MEQGESPALFMCMGHNFFGTRLCDLCASGMASSKKEQGCYFCYFYMGHNVTRMLHEMHRIVVYDQDKNYSQA